MDGILSLDLTVGVNDAIQTVLEILEKVKPDWKAEDTDIQTSSGLLNHLYICSNQAQDDTPVIVRVHVSDQVELFTEKRRNEEKLTMKMLAETGHICPLYASFQNGYVHGFNPGRTLSRKDFHDDDILRKIASEQHRLHHLDWDKVHGATKDDPLKVLLTLTLLWEIIQKSAESISAINEVTTFDQLLREKDEAMELYRNLTDKYPLQFCHLDTQSLNIIYDKDADKITFIDWELADWSIELLDVFGVTDKDIEMSGEFVGPEYRKKYLRIYLSSHPIYAADEKDERKFMEWYRDLLLVCKVCHLSMVVAFGSMAKGDLKDTMIKMMRHFYKMYHDIGEELKGLGQ